MKFTKNDLFKWAVVVVLQGFIKRNLAFFLGGIAMFVLASMALFVYSFPWFSLYVAAGLLCGLMALLFTVHILMYPRNLMDRKLTQVINGPVFNPVTILGGTEILRQQYMHELKGYKYEFMCLFDQTNHIIVLLKIRAI